MLRHLIKPLSLRDIRVNRAYLDVLLLAFGEVVQDKINKQFQILEKHNAEVLGVFHDGVFAGVVVYHLSDTGVTVDYVAVAKSFQHQGLGNALIGSLISREAPALQEPETDEDGSRFYEKQGFICTATSSEYVRQRYRCVKNFRGIVA